MNGIGLDWGWGWVLPEEASMVFGAGATVSVSSAILLLVRGALLSLSGLEASQGAFRGRKKEGRETDDSSPSHCQIPEKG